MNSYIFIVIANTPDLFVIVQFCNWLCENVCNDEVDSLLIYFTNVIT